MLNTTREYEQMIDSSTICDMPEKKIKDKFIWFPKTCCLPYKYIHHDGAIDEATTK